MKKPLKPLDIEKTLKEIGLLGFRRWLILHLNEAYKDARKGKYLTVDENIFDINSVENIIGLAKSIEERTYEPGASIAFVVFEPMVREIFAAPFRDRLVHHFLYNMQAGWWDARFIYDNYSCRVGKGTGLGIKRTQRFMQVASENFTKEAVVMKNDLKGYFMSIPRQKLLKRIYWGIDLQFKNYTKNPEARKLIDICKFLWGKVILDDPVKKAIRRGPLKNWSPEILPPRKSLFTQPPGQGLVIGNLTSQLSSNIYLDQLDRFVKNELGYEYYGRYVDDFYRIVPLEELSKLKSDTRLIKQYLEEELLLTLHPDKVYCQNIKKGLPFLGARIYPHCVYPSDRLQAKFRLTLKEFKKNQKSWENVQAYLGLMKHQDAEKFIQKILEEFGD